MPKISVIIAVKNMEETIHSAVASVLLQSERDLNVIIVDNGSTDHTVSAVQHLMEIDKRVSLQHCTMPGPFPCRNQAMQNMDCDYMAVMDGDDLCLPTRLEEQVQALDENANLSAVGSQIIYFGDQSNTPHMARGTKECRDLISLFNPCCHPTLLVRRMALDKVGLYDTSYTIGGDYDFVRRLTYCGDVKNIERPLLLYRAHQKQITAQRSKFQSLTAYTIRKEHLSCMRNGREISDTELLLNMTNVAIRAR